MKVLKLDNGWFHINDLKPEANETVVAIIERDESAGCTYDFDEIVTTYRIGASGEYFDGENEAWKVRYWRRKDIYPYPSGVVKKEIEYCKKHNIDPYKIIEHQEKCGVKV